MKTFASCGNPKQNHMQIIRADLPATHGVLHHVKTFASYGKPKQNHMQKIHAGLPATHGILWQTSAAALNRRTSDDRQTSRRVVTAKLLPLTQSTPQESYSEKLLWNPM